MIEIKGQSCIAGNWITPPGSSFHSFNPYKKEVMYRFASCGAGEIEQAALAAESAFHIYRNLDGKPSVISSTALPMKLKPLGISW